MNLSTISTLLLKSSNTPIGRDLLNKKQNKPIMSLSDISNVCTDLNTTFKEIDANHPESYSTESMQASRFNQQYTPHSNIHNVTHSMKSKASQPGTVHIADHDNASIDLPDNDCWDIGDPNWECSSCNALMWYHERINKKRQSKNPEFSMCCAGGKVQLPLLKEPPHILKALLNGSDHRSRHFIDNICAYNMMFSFTSMGGKIDSSLNNGKGPSIFRLHGQNCHKIGSLIPNIGSTPKFAQLYIYDTENEIANRIGVLSSTNNSKTFESSIVADLRKMLDENNVVAQSFRMARDRFDSRDFRDVKLRLIGKRNCDGRRYNLPAAPEVAGLIVGDIGSSNNDRDIIVETQNGLLKRISELHPL